MDCARGLDRKGSSIIRVLWPRRKTRLPSQAKLVRTFRCLLVKKKRDSASSCAFLIDPTLSASCIKSPEYIIRVHRFSIDGNVVYTAEAFPTPRRRAPNKEVNSGGSPTGHLLLFSSPLLSFLTLLSPHLHNNSILFSLVDRQKFHFVSFSNTLGRHWISFDIWNFIDFKDKKKLQDI